MALRYGHLAPEHLRTTVARSRCSPSRLRINARINARGRERGGPAPEV